MKILVKYLKYKKYLSFRPESPGVSGSQAQEPWGQLGWDTKVKYFMNFKYFAGISKYFQVFPWKTLVSYMFSYVFGGFFKN